MVEDGGMKVDFRLLIAARCVSAIGLVGLVGCGNSVVNEEPVDEVKVDQLVARVASVYEEEGYALVQRYGRVDLEDESILYTLNDVGETSNLKVTGERLGQFLAVDIMSGDPVVGDGVFVRNFEIVEEESGLTPLNKNGAGGTEGGAEGGSEPGNSSNSDGVVEGFTPDDGITDGLIKPES